MRYPNLRHLEIFRSLVQTRNVTETAALLNISQPAVSKAMAQLQRSTELTLFSRVGGRLRPSADGLRLLAEAEAMLNQANAFAAETLALREARGGRLSVGAIPALALGAVGSAARRFCAEHPSARLEFRLDMSAAIVEQVATRRIDLGFVHGRPANPQVECRHIDTSRMACLLAEDHPLAARPYLTPLDLKSEPLVILDITSPPGHLLREVFAAVGLPLDAVIETNSSHLVPSLLGRHQIAFVDMMAVLGGGDTGFVVRPFRPEVPLRIFAISSHNAPSRLAAVFETLAAGEIAARLQAA